MIQKATAAQDEAKQDDGPWIRLETALKAEDFPAVRLELEALPKTLRQDYRFRLYSGLAAENSGDLEAAVNLLRGAVVLKPQDYRSGYHLGRLALWTNQLDLAQSILVELQKAHPEKPKLLLLVAELHEKLGAWPEAAAAYIAMAEAFKAKGQDIPEKSFVNIIGFIASGGPRRGLELAERLQQLYPESPELFDLAVGGHRKTFAFTRAWSLVSGATAIRITASPEYWQHLLELSAMFEQRPAMLKRLAALPPAVAKDERVYPRLHGFYQSMGMEEQAERLIREAPPSVRRSTLEIGHLVKEGRVDEAIALARREVSSDEISEEDSVEIWKQLFSINDTLDRHQDNLRLYDLLPRGHKGNDNIRSAVVSSILESDGTAAALAWMKRHWPKAGDGLEGMLCLARAHIETSDFDAAQEVIKRLQSKFSANQRVVLLKAVFLREQFKVEAARKELAQWLDRFPECLPVWLQYIQLTVRVSDFRMARVLLDRLLERFPGERSLLNERASLAIIENDVPAAADALGKLPFSIATEGRVLKQVWLHAQRGEHAEAKSLWERHVKVRPQPHLSRPIRDWRRLDDRVPDTRPGGVTLITKVRDESMRLPFLLTYYRRMGVTSFIFVDNGSVDGTVEHLLAQPDCHVYQTTDVLSRAPSARWINQVMDEHPGIGWTLCVDSDEFLIYPGCETITIPQLIAYLEKAGSDIVPGYMLECIPKDYKKMISYREGDDILQHSPWYETNYEFRGNAAYPFMQVYGGALERLMSTKETTQFKGVIKVKSPLIRSGAGIRFTNANHTTTPGMVSPVMCTLLHFKFVGDMKKRAEDSVKKYGYYLGGRNYHRYIEFFSGYKGDFTSSESRRYTSSMELFRIGLISAPESYFRHFGLDPWSPAPSVPVPVKAG